MPDISEVKVKKPRKKYPKTTKKGTKDFTREQKAAILKRAEEVGINQTAEEFGSSWQAVAAMQREARASGELPPKPSKANRPKRTPGRKPKLMTVVENIAETVPAKEAIINEQPVAEKATISPSYVKHESEKKHTPLEIENVILREKVVALTEQIEKLRLAVSQLA